MIVFCSKVDKERICLAMETPFRLLNGTVVAAGHEHRAKRVEVNSSGVCPCRPNPDARKYIRASNGVSNFIVISRTNGKNKVDEF